MLKLTGDESYFHVNKITLDYCPPEEPTRAK